MFNIILYYLAVGLTLLFAIFLLIYSFYSLKSQIIGSPYVPTKKDEIGKILTRAKLEKGQHFYELGAGDGRVVKEAVKRYQVKGLAVEINPLLVYYARLLSWFEKLEHITFRRNNFFQTDLAQADVIFLFLMPKVLERLKPKIARECKKDILVISHGFKIDGWSKYLESKIDSEPFPTYFYRRL